MLIPQQEFAASSKFQFVIKKMKRNPYGRNAHKAQTRDDDLKLACDQRGLNNESTK